MAAYWNASVAQLVEQYFRKVEVVGSNPTAGSVMKYRGLYSVLVVSIILTLLHLVGVFYHFYDTDYWFDVAPHFMGGVVSAAAFLYLSVYIPRINRTSFVVAGTVSVLLGWEVFEYIVGLFAEPQYLFDTSVDIFMGILGALCSWKYRQAF